MSAHLSKNFTLEELTRTDTGLPNVPNDVEIEKLSCLAMHILQPIRDALGEIIVHSAFRSEAVNEAVGGVYNSQHRLAEAADIHAVHYDDADLFSWIRKNIRFGQLIVEQKTRPDGTKSQWIHVSRERMDKPNGMLLAYNNGVYTTIA